jgi:hypothetical protein
VEVPWVFPELTVTGAKLKNKIKKTTELDALYSLNMEI